MRLREPEPMVVAEREAHVGALEMLERRHDVEHRELLDPVGVIERQPVRHPRAAVVAAAAEAIVAERAHQLDHVPRHLGLGVGRVVGSGSGLEGACIAAQVRADHGEAAGQSRRHLVPHDVALRVAVQQKERRPRAAHADPKRTGADRDRAEFESVEKAHAALRSLVSALDRSGDLATARRGAGARLAGISRLGYPADELRRDAGRPLPEGGAPELAVIEPAKLVIPAHGIVARHGNGLDGIGRRLGRGGLGSRHGEEHS